MGKSKEIEIDENDQTFLKFPEDDFIQIEDSPYIGDDETEHIDAMLTVTEEIDDLIESTQILEAFFKEKDLTTLHKYIKMSRIYLMHAFATINACYYPTTIKGDFNGNS